MTDENVVVKKIKPYPIQCELIDGDKIHKVNIIKLEPIGFLVENDKLILRTGTRLNARFVLPVFNKVISSEVILVKTIDSFIKPGTTNEIMRLLEFHLVKPNDTIKSAIKEFYEEINKK